ncbi:fumarylacetoacetate hydrolase family protein [Desulfovibrio subterraneus]|jgi:2-keto-4-pentenoate hydratase/2-oxohepta-3-ene-1,7-dioic acid hydratase in catechol pathway|uniref:2-hydroxyhepta-2,4-diene-1,7-dioate isomerase n=1 Tax=Desulfovibrio subterraneus TaxID=2718620 RepID=A0A7J0BIL7_9BACT|nr:fumarylacetoacetate hydrolase family protein [Desulfovibrio subterraneus]WBF67190.1 fumarylacetoacetate hydrolase family protein [Desulfovibrio subterraneus]GFM32934.1 2-hydroxyhepta-2,4-diene-1,7-dioate isomerase [Desulfovibrio subterraneus]
MRVLRVRYNNTAFYAALREDTVLCLNPQLGLVDPIPLEDVSILPVVTPSKIVCVGLNYRAHAAELGMPVSDEPVYFLKPPSAVIGSGQPILLPEISKQVDYEAELAIVIGKECRRLRHDQVPDSIFGFTCANDVTARDLQKNDPWFGRCKGFDTFLPIGPWIETDVKNPDDLTIRCIKNGQVMQEGHTSDMLFSPYDLVVHISQVMTLLPGDVILTGTPPGIGPMQPGDEIRVEVENMGLLINPVRDSMGRTGEDEVPLQ